MKKGENLHLCSIDGEEKGLHISRGSRQNPVIFAYVFYFFKLNSKVLVVCVNCLNVLLYMV